MTQENQTCGDDETAAAVMERAKHMSEIDPSLGLISLIADMQGKTKPYSAKETGQQIYTVDFYTGESRTFTTRDSAKHYRHQSFREDYRAASDLAGMVARIEDVRKLAEIYLRRAPESADTIKQAFDAHAEKHIQFSLEYIRNNSNLVSAMIAGPSNFPVARMKKKQDHHHNRWTRLCEHIKIGNKRIKRAAFPNGDPKDGIRSDNPDAVRLLEEKIALLERNQDYYKKANRDVKAAMKTADPVAAMIAKDYTEEQARGYTAFDYSWMKTRAFDSYVTTNNLANIKRLKGRLAGLKRTKATVSEIQNYELDNGETFEIVRNSGAMRLQLLFSGKPSNLTRAALKSNGFRWAPSHSAWQRHLNNNSEYALKRLLSALEAKESAKE